ncbi:hypothetical protein FPCIR_10225 [Fusarium pseudocircinatum]|uniref:Uncharacterized protein n=1 Tax=Fusarium pseudocircinatum TaxID=56676 RepID=A0A8H5KVF0_9HYPO|nr:hypothetical protein FPCIR_10225 [Fusarium pseudocircinatum]
MRLKLALRLGNKLEDLIYNTNQMLFKWDGMIHELMNAMAEGSLPNVGDIESLTTNGTTTQETTTDPEKPPVSSDEPLDAQELETLDPHRALQYHDAITEFTVRTVDWKPLIDTLNVRRLIQADVLSMVETLWDDLGEETADGARLSRVDSNEIDETTKVRLMSRLLNVIARLADVFIRRWGGRNRYGSILTQITTGIGHEIRTEIINFRPSLSNLMIFS